jgi:inosose dehydratase
VKVAAAPISWGVSEAAGWGYRMAPERVLAEMRRVGFDATERWPPASLGQGDLDIEGGYDRLRQAGYQGWFVFEQDSAGSA